MKGRNYRCLLLSRWGLKNVDHAKANGLLVPLNGYNIYIYGASVHELSPQAWVTIKGFWTMYFSTAEADVVVYSADYDLHR